MARAGMIGMIGQRGIKGPSGGGLSPAVNFYWTDAGRYTLASATEVTTNGNASNYSCTIAALPTTGKYYIEITVAGGSISSHGFTTATAGAFATDTAYWDNTTQSLLVRRFSTAGWWTDKPSTFGAFTENGAPPTYGSSQLIRIALDADNDKIWMQQDNGGWIGSGNPAAGTGATLDYSNITQALYFVMGHSFGNQATIVVTASHTYTAPSGFTAIGGAA